MFAFKQRSPSLLYPIVEVVLELMTEDDQSKKHDVVLLQIFFRTENKTIESDHITV